MPKQYKSLAVDVTTVTEKFNKDKPSQTKVVLKGEDVAQGVEVTITLKGDWRKGLEVYVPLIPGEKRLFCLADVNRTLDEFTSSKPPEGLSVDDPANFKEQEMEDFKRYGTPDDMVIVGAKKDKAKKAKDIVSEGLNPTDKDLEEEKKQRGRRRRAANMQEDEK